MSHFSNARIGLLAVVVGLFASGTVGCVDETGYESDDAGEIFVDETGYLCPDQIFYSATARLDVERSVTVLGMPGALCPPGGTLRLTGPGDPELISLGDDGSFRVALDASSGDTLTFRYTPPDEDEGFDTLTFDDALDDVEAPGPPGTSSGPPLLSVPDVNGLVTVELSALSSGVPPYIVFNLAGDDTGARSDDGSAVTVAAAADDVVCIFSARPDEGVQSPHLCEVVPAS